MLEFTRVSGHPAVSQYTKDEWYRDHGKEFVYSFGNIFDFRYQDGMNMGPVEDWGEWTMLASNKDGKQKDPPTWFLGGYAWIEKFNREHGNQSAQDDDPEHGHISVDTTTVYVHYRYENGSNEMTDYTMHINRLTGRFVERFESPAVNDQRTGTCLVFK